MYSIYIHVHKTADVFVPQDYENTEIPVLTWQGLCHTGKKKTVNLSELILNK